MPKISVIIPAYNVEKYIEKTLKSLIDQTFKDFEAIIINDGIEGLQFYDIKNYWEKNMKKWERDK